MVIWDWEQVFRINFLGLLRQFHKLMFIKTGDWRADTGQKFIANNPTAILRAELVREEAFELIEALKTGTEKEVRKELCDLLYVTFGTAAVYDFNVDRDFNLVHKNNMLKFEGGKMREDGKWLKPDNHPKVELP